MEKLKLKHWIYGDKTVPIKDVKALVPIRGMIRVDLDNDCLWATRIDVIEE